MKVIEISGYRYESMITDMAKHFRAEVKEDCDEFSFRFDNKVGQGIVRGINFDHGVSLMMCDFTLQEDVSFFYDLGRRHPIKFMYSHSGAVRLHSEGLESDHEISDNQAIIYAPNGQYRYSMDFRAGHRIQCVFVSVIRYLFLRQIECDIDTIPSVLGDMFRDTVGHKSFYFTSSSEPVTATVLMQLFASDQTGLERKLLLESNALKLITSMIKRYRVESDIDGGAYRFSQSDIKALNIAKNFIIDNIELTPTVRELAQMIGMNTNKLQKGFRMLFDKSIRQFTITFKMHIALNLLDEGELSISEVAYRIGYTNKGHFSQLFKKEFGRLPSQYIERSKG